MLGMILDWKRISLTQKAKPYSHNLIVYIAPPVINNIMKPKKWLNVFNNYYISYMHVKGHEQVLILL